MPKQQDMKLHHAKSKGFTLIELVIVIIVLGILAATAAPKFINLRVDAKIATLESVRGSIQSALQLVYARAVIQGQSSGIGVIDINGTAVPLYNGYPSVRGRDSIAKLNQQVQAWLDIDSVDADEAQQDNNVAPFYIAKSTAKNYIYIFLSSEREHMSATYKCQIRYENPVTATPKPAIVTIQTDACY